MTMSSNALQTQSPTSSTSPPKDSQLTGRILTFDDDGHIKEESTVTSVEAQKYSLSVHRIRKPDIELMLGQKGGTITAVCYIKSWSRTYHIGLGQDDTSREWIDYKTKFWPKEPTFAWKGETYVLKRVFQDDNGDQLEKAKRRGYFGVRDGAGRWVALYSPCKGDGKRTAVLKFADGGSEELEQLIILGICSWKEEMRRAG